MHNRKLLGVSRQVVRTSGVAHTRSVGLTNQGIRHAKACVAPSSPLEGGGHDLCFRQAFANFYRPQVCVPEFARIRELQCCMSRSVDTRLSKTETDIFRNWNGLNLEGRFGNGTRSNGKGVPGRGFSGDTLEVTRSLSSRGTSLGKNAWPTWR